MLIEKGCLLYGLVNEDDRLKYSFITSFDKYARHFKNNNFPAMNSLKNLFIPPRGILYVIDRNYVIHESSEENIDNIVLFGVKPCDYYSLKILDKLLENDVYYYMRRMSVKHVIIEECLNPSKYCFCGSLNTGPEAVDGYDISYAVIDENVLFKVASRAGSLLADSLGLETAPNDLLEKYHSLIEYAKKRISKLPDMGNCVNKLESVMKDRDLWVELAGKCVGCGNCNMVCPTCMCTEFLDRIVGEKAYRFRIWTGCLSYTYGLTAGYHYRPELYMRSRHFILHKFLFQPFRYNTIGCVGCGRCLAWCPMNVDFIELLKRVCTYDQV